MITFLKGDTTATITLALAEGFDYSNKTVCLEYQGVQLTFSSPIAGGSLIFCFTAGETASMSLGSFPVRVWLEDENGNVTTIHNADVKMRVTDCIADVHSGGAIYLDVRGGLSGIDGLPERYTDKDLHDKINEILRRLGGTVAALLLCALPAFGASLTLHTAPKGVIYNDQQLVTNATLDVSGLASVEDLAGKADAVRASTSEEIASCSWWDGGKLLAWNGENWSWSNGMLGGSRELMYHNGRWSYAPSVVPGQYYYTNSVPIYGLPPSLVLYNCDGYSVTLTRTNEVYAVVTNVYTAAYMDDIAMVTNALNKITERTSLYIRANIDGDGKTRYRIFTAPTP